MASLEHLRRELVRALRTDDLRRIKLILNSPDASLDWLNKPIESGGNHAVHIGADAGFDDGVHALLEFGVNANVVNQDGETALHVAAERRFADMLDLLCIADKVNVDARRKRDGMTPLHIAALRGSPECVQVLVDNKADMNRTDFEGNTPLLLAVHNGRYAVVSKLLSNGASQKIKNKHQQTPLSYAMKISQDKKLIKILVETKPHVIPSSRDTSESVPRTTTKFDMARGGNKAPAVRREATRKQDVLRRDIDRNLERITNPNRVFLTDLPVNSRSRAAYPTGGGRSNANAVHRNAVQEGLTRQVANQLNKFREDVHVNDSREEEKRLKSAGVQVDERTASSDSEDDEDEKYKMTAKPRGLCIIINNQDYLNTDDFKPRAGTDADEKRLELLFKSLKFHVKVFKNLDAREIYWNIQNYARADHSEFDCFVCCILSHGTMGAIYGVDGKKQKLCDLTVSLSSTLCPSLAGKPKLFFIQACRGQQAQSGFALNQLESDAVPSSTEGISAPDHADFLIGYATVAQHIAQRHRETGSIYIQTLCDIIQKEHKRSDLLSMLVKVNDKVSRHVFKNDDGTRFVQMPEVKQTLRRKVVFS